MLPDQFIIRYDNSPFWMEFIEWLNASERANFYWNGNNNNCYYGISEEVTIGSRYKGTICANEETRQKYPPEVKEITLEEWKEAISAPEESYNIF